MSSAINADDKEKRLEELVDLKRLDTPNIKD
jgi:hypothetical protein